MAMQCSRDLPNILSATFHVRVIYARTSVRGKSAVPPYVCTPCTYTLTFTEHQRGWQRAGMRMFVRWARSLRVSLCKHAHGRTQVGTTGLGMCSIRLCKNVNSVQFCNSSAYFSENPPTMVQ